MKNSGNFLLFTQNPNQLYISLYIFKSPYKSPSRHFLFSLEFHISSTLSVVTHFISQNTQCWALEQGIQQNFHLPYWHLAAGLLNTIMTYLNKFLLNWIKYNTFLLSTNHLVWIIMKEADSIFWCLRAAILSFTLSSSPSAEYLFKSVRNFGCFLLQCLWQFKVTQAHARVGTLTC